MNSRLLKITKVTPNINGYLKLFLVQRFYTVAWNDVAKGVIAKSNPANVGDCPKKSEYSKIEGIIE